MEIELQFDQIQIQFSRHTYSKYVTILIYEQTIGISRASCSSRRLIYNNIYNTFRYLFPKNILFPAFLVHHSTMSFSQHKL